MSRAGTEGNRIGLWTSAATLAVALSFAAGHLRGFETGSRSMAQEGSRSSLGARAETRLGEISRQLAGLREDVHRTASTGEALRERFAAIEEAVGGSTGSILAAAPSGGEVEPVALQDPAQRTLFGIDLGSAGDLASLRSRWAMVGGAAGLPLRPLAAFHETAGGDLQIKLVAGPFHDARDAAIVCARLRAVAPHCAPTGYSGHALSSAD